MMTDTLPLIQNRRKEIGEAIARLKSDIAAMERELAELDTAARVVARLSGGAPAEEDHTTEESTEGGKPAHLPTMPEMILQALREGERRGKIGLEPKEITAFVSQAYWAEVKGEQVSAIVWRMWKRGQLDKDGPLYIRMNEKVADHTSVGDRPATLFPNSAKGREAGPGGGT